MYEIGKAEIDAVARVIRSGRLYRDFGGQGSECEQFEAALAETVGVRYALTTCSGTTAMVCGLAGLGVGPGDEVIVPAYTFIATALAVLVVGAIPIVADVDETLTLDPADLERRITRHTKAVIPVHMVGRPCDMAAIMRIARRRKLLVLEDACQAVGGSYRRRRLGAIGHVGVYSFNYYKNITCGEGGAVLTDDRDVYERSLIGHDGGITLYTHADRPGVPMFAGSKFRISEIQGAILREQLKRLDRILARLRTRRAAMREILAASDAFRLNPDNDARGDCGSTLPLLFETDKDALAFIKAHGKRVGMYRPFDTGKHVYTHWEALFAKRGNCDRRRNPYRFARRKIKYSKDMCKASLEILARTVNVTVPYEATVAQARAAAKGLLP